MVEVGAEHLANKRISHLNQYETRTGSNCCQEIFIQSEQQKNMQPLLLISINQVDGASSGNKEAGV